MYCKVNDRFRKVYKRDDGTYYCLLDGKRVTVRKSQVKPGKKPNKLPSKRKSRSRKSRFNKSSVPRLLQVDGYKFSSNPNTRLKALRKAERRYGFKLTVKSLQSSLKKSPSAKGIVRADLSKLRMVLQAEKSRK
jgi:hypothetical protein